MVMERKGLKEPWVSRMSESIASSLMHSKQLNRLEFLKIKLGLEVLLINLMKGGIVYGLSIVTGTFWLTFITHTSYFSLRVCKEITYSKANIHF